MAVLPEPKEEPLFATPEHREEMYRLSRWVNEQAGFTGPLTMTPEDLQAAQRARGVKPEDRAGTTELMKMRYGDDWDPSEWDEEF